jgi:hypothetical protein
MTFFWAPGCFFWFPGVLGAKVDDARDGSWRRYFVALLYLAAKSAHVGVDVDRLACPLHRPMACGRQMRGQGLLLGTVLSHHYSWAMAPFRGDVKPPGLDIRWSIDRVDACGTESYKKYIVFYRGHAYPLSESSWH